MKYVKSTLLALSLLALSISCNDKKFLDVQPTGALSDDQLNTPANIEKQVIAAYSQLGNDVYRAPYTSMWPYGNVRGGDAYKGGSGTGRRGRLPLLRNLQLQPRRRGQHRRAVVPAFTSAFRAATMPCAASMR